MEFDALKGLERLDPKHVTKKKKPTPPPVKEKPKKVKEVVLPPDDEDDFDNADSEGMQVVRTPRVVPAAKRRNVDEVSKESTLLESRMKLGLQDQTEARREAVLAWMLNGRLHEGQLVTIDQLAEILDVPLKTVEYDVTQLKEKMAKYHLDGDTKDTAALAYMLLEMRFQDRGRALQLHNRIMADILESDNNEVEYVDKNGKHKTVGALTGRDRAAMYSAALACLDLSNKAVSGLDSLFKLTGGAQKLQFIIKTQNAQFNSGNGQVISMTDLQQLAADELNGVLPSIRKQKALPAPKTIEMTPEDEEIMSVGLRERGNK